MTDDYVQHLERAMAGKFAPPLRSKNDGLDF